MKISLFVSVSVNGKILLAGNPGHQVPQEVIGNFMERAMQAGSLILGRKTFDMFLQYEVVRQELSGTETVVLSENPGFAEKAHIVNNPHEAINYLQSRGFETALIGGGTHTYRSFLEKDLVTDLYVNVLPVISSAGGDLVDKTDFILNFKLGEQRMLTTNITQLHYIKV